ncbi:MAG: peptidase domain-containing ABC transporter [Runella slithyformis]|nr:MAG: peptidase domain-containing ABC transporter [Runella slithyformis]TAF24902.1 MAG: peptidase domain-containing ABC transporter [Runella slithyformis]TAF48865.1 MAG: peptidase domain-containing ABC transporter [Runella slithyformis]TAF79760.1 MAG: peptidase domain-containing ABC transporter [Runella slithyformis]
MKKFPYFQQLDQMDCGPTCLRMVAKYYGRSYSTAQLRELAEIGKDGVNLLGIAQAAERVGFKALGVKVTLQKLLEEAPLPCIVHWGQNHFVVVAPNPQRESFSPFSFKRRRGQGVEVADPAAGLLTYTLQEFESRWATTVNEDGQKVGIALLLEAPPAPGGGAIDFDENKNRKVGLRLLWGQVWRYRGLLFQVGLGLLAGSLLQLMLPFLTKSVVDVGIQTRNLQFVYLVLGAQLALMVGRMSVEFIRSWILLHISTRVNLSILSDFLAKLLRLPIAYFEAKTTGDIMQRIGDHRRIEQFLTGTSLNVLFSMVNLVVFSFVLAYYSLPIFGVFMAGSALYAIWIMLFLKRRRALDHKQFALGAQSQNNLMQLIASVPELKLNNAELKKRWEWENIQVRDFKLSMKGLALQQYQQAGALFLNEGKNIIISFLAATAVIQGQMTLGGMMALQYIIGQLNSPVEQLIQFVQHWQDAQISLERLNEVNTLDDESPPAPDGGAISLLPFKERGQGVRLSGVTFTYAGAGNEPVLKNINLHIPQGKTTAIVGSSGSGKTTLLKLLLRFYEPQIGNIDLTPAPLLKTGEGLRQWRKKCGTVLQDGFIFSDTIANNIAISDETTDFGKVMNAIQVANLQDFIISLPLGLNTKIGIEGNGISQGQRQRILIARAVYKNPEYLFFDEATNALDTENEAIIMKNLAAFSQNKTVVVVAHRLSTVKNADQIVVLEKGEIVEIGTHYELAAKRGRYFELVSNQLELAP